MIVLKVLLVFITFSRVSSEDLLRSRFPFYGISEIAAKSHGKEKNSCNGQLKNVFHALNKREKWALKLLDASGSPVGGFLRGDNYWLGSYSQCRWISSGKQKVFSSFRSPFDLQPFGVAFFIGLFRQNLVLSQSEFDAPSKRTIHLGLCLPSVCSPEDLNPLLSQWAKENPLETRSLYNFTTEFQSVRLIETDWSWIYSPLTIPMGLAIVIVAILSISGTVYDVYVSTPLRNRIAINETRNGGKKVQETRNIQESSELLKHDYNLNECYELKIDNSQHKSMPVHVSKSAGEKSKVEKPKRSFFVRLSSCFSVTSNMKIFFSKSGTKTELSIIHGIRFLAMNWVIWHYVEHYLNSYAGNKQSLLTFSKEYSERKINSSFSLDTLFFTSGFLLAYKHYKEGSGSLKIEPNFSVKKKVNEFSFAALQRYLRLTPAYLLIIGLVMVSVKMTRQTSLFEVIDPADEICRKTWWRNVAYINNLFKETELCVSWTWFLSMDMQFFLLGLFLLILSTRFWKFVTFLSSGLIVMSSFTNGYYYTSMSKPQLHNFLISSPWARVEPYLIGMLTAYFSVNLKGELVLKKITLLTCWMLGMACSAWALFGLHMSYTSINLHAALSRIAWTFGLSWLVIACCTRNAGALKSILSFHGWTWISQLYYSVYLLTPIIIILLTTNAETALQLDFVQMVVYFLGSAIIIYFWAFLFFITFEIPLKTFGKQTFGSKKTQNQLDQPL